MKSIELFSGAGGMALGLRAAGFEHVALIEWNKDACSTLRRNGVADVYEKDVRTFNFTPLCGTVELLAAGAPCQPFSLGGKHGGQRDDRNMFPEVVRAIRECRPRAVLIENVRGLIRPRFWPYFEYVLMQIALPELKPKPAESWRDHRGRLVPELCRQSTGDLRYAVDYRLINCADYGVPQLRYRVFVVALRADLGVEWHWPRPSHSREALEAAKAGGEYWLEHGISPRRSRSRPLHPQVGMARWRTVRDALKGLPDPRGEEAGKFPNHVFVPGARQYPGHSGSFLDEPGKTLKAGDHGNPGGENTIIEDSGAVRYLTVREAARLQTISDEYEFVGTRSECMRQLGNAVPLLLARVLGNSIAGVLRGYRPTRIAKQPSRPKWIAAEQLSLT